MRLKLWECKINFVSYYTTNVSPAQHGGQEGEQGGEAGPGGAVVLIVRVGGSAGHRDHQYSHLGTIE